MRESIATARRHIDGDNLGLIIVHNENLDQTSLRIHRIVNREQQLRRLWTRDMQTYEIILVPQHTVRILHKPQIDIVVRYPLQFPVAVSDIDLHRTAIKRHVILRLRHLQQLDEHTGIARHQQSRDHHICHNTSKHSAKIAKMPV